MRTQLASALLRNDQRVVIDRTWSKAACKHNYKVLVTSENGGIIYGYMADTTNEDEAAQTFLEIATEWGVKA